MQSQVLQGFFTVSCNFQKTHGNNKPLILIIFIILLGTSSLDGKERVVIYV